MRRRSRLVIMLRSISDELGVTQKKWGKSLEILYVLLCSTEKKKLMQFDEINNCLSQSLKSMCF